MSSATLNSTSETVLLGRSAVELHRIADKVSGIGADAGRFTVADVFKRVAFGIIDGQVE